MIPLLQCWIFSSNLYDLLVNMVDDAKKQNKTKKHQEVPGAKLAGSSMKVKAMAIFHHSLALCTLANYLRNNFLIWNVLIELRESSKTMHVKHTAVCVTRFNHTSQYECYRLVPILFLPSKCLASSVSPWTELDCIQVDCWIRNPKIWVVCLG